MRGRREESIEAVVDRGAAALLAAAVAFACLSALPPEVVEFRRMMVSAASAALAYWLSARVLRRTVARPPKFEVPHFVLPQLEIADAEELVLTDAHRLQRTIAGLAGELVLTDSDRLHPTHPAMDELLLTDADRLVAPVATEELLLEDILTELGPDSRVVRLFDPAAMPTPGQLNARIERHLHGDRSSGTPEDASKALYDALSELRRSLR